MRKYHAPALDKGLDIIEYLSKMAIPQSQSEIASGLERSANEFYRMLMSLEERGYIIKNPATGKFSLSLKLYQLSHRHSPVDGLLRGSKPHMEELAHITKQSCHLSILERGKLMVISQVKGPGPVSLSIEEGSIFPLAKTTSGRVILAFCEEGQRQKLLEEDTDYKNLGKSDQQKFINHLIQIKMQGHDQQESEITKGVADLAVPVGYHESGVFGVLAISSLSQFSGNQKSNDALIGHIKATAQMVNKSVGLL